LLVYNALEWEFQMFDIDSDPNCNYCKNEEITEYPEYIDYEQTCAV